MIGIVAVSHSARLGEAALELALQMVPGGGVPVRVAAGAGVDADGEPILGTDAVAVSAAIDELAAEVDGVLVLMDLGSAVLSAELALELRSSDVPVRLAPAPFVEGLLAAVVAAAAGGDLDAVAAEAASALAAKTGQLGPTDDATAEDIVTSPAESAPDGAEPAEETVSRRVRVRNPLGIHARPAALIAESAAGADVRLRRLPDGPEAAAGSLTRLLALGARQGTEIELTGRGADAEAAVDRLASLFEGGFGEGVETDEGAAGSPGTAPAPARATAGDDQAGARADRESAPTPEIVSGSVMQGRGVSPGRVAARAVSLAPALPEPDADAVVPPEGREAEVSTIEWAAVAVADQLRSRAERARGEARAILDASRLLASDPELVAEATALVRAQGRTAARAVWETSAAHEAALAALGGRMAERAADIRDVRDRMIAEILRVDMPGVPERDEPFALVATDLAPADTAALDGGNCVALVTADGGPTSHTAIIARALGLPAVVGVPGATGIPEGAMLLVDGDRGTIHVDPDEAEIAEARAAAVVVTFDGRGRLADGTRVPLLANVGGASDAGSAAPGIRRITRPCSSGRSRRRRPWGPRRTSRTPSSTRPGPRSSSAGRRCSRTSRTAAPGHARP